MKILVADDDQSILNSFDFLLREMGIQPTLVNNGLKAKDALLGQHYDIVISDFIMQDLDGYELLSWIRRRGERVFFVLMSGYHNETVTEGFKRLQADMILPKPFSAKDIERCISEYSRRTSELQKPDSKKDVEQHRKALLERMASELPGFMVAAVLDATRITMVKSDAAPPFDEAFIKSNATAVIDLKRKAVKAQKLDDEKIENIMISTSTLVFYIKLLDKDGYILYLVASKQEAGLSILQLVINKYVKQLLEAK
ncbi:MAG: response regulator [Chlorobiales bacterium]|jgi:DNA-binding response OmpR family regulator|nr:response regulator [Chlorobiales bacterium]